ncbi:DUF6175 family protein [Kordia sp. SMS9]|uniref:DUF6175 family protein n=1 Tax=Kordia sp. SMS9 TaxID=2282170 RepID=UPI000E0D06DD|nr:DUF6175 family protein [Kordia sp. SMS9]
MKKYILIVLLTFIGINLEAYAQTKVTQVQPSIMVIPWVKEGQDIRTILEDDFNKRIAIAKVKEAFDNRGFTTYDFTQKLKQALNETAVKSDEKNDLKSRMIRLSTADIIVEVEVFVQKSSGGNSVKLIMEGKDSYTAQSLVTKTGESGKFYTDDIAKLSQKAVESCVEEFLNTMNDKFGQIVENGRSVRINIGFHEDSEYNMDSEIGDDADLLSDLLEDWLDENAHNNNFHIQGMTELSLIVDDFRIPLKDPKTGRNYRATKVSSKLRKFIKNKLGLAVKQGKRSAAEINIIIQ